MSRELCALSVTHVVNVTKGTLVLSTAETGQDGAWVVTQSRGDLPVLTLSAPCVESIPRDAIGDAVIVEANRRLTLGKIVVEDDEFGLAHVLVEQTCATPIGATEEWPGFDAVNLTWQLLYVGAKSLREELLGPLGGSTPRSFDQMFP